MTANSFGQLSATYGLISYKEGRPELGAQLYQLSIDRFIKDGDESAASLAYAFWAKEMAISCKNKGLELINRAKSLAKKYGNKEVGEILKRIK